MNTKVLVTDGLFTNALAVVRSLSSHYYVGVTSHFPRWMTPSSLSRHVKQYYHLKSEQDNLDDYAEELVQLVQLEGYDVLLPISLKSYLAVSKHKKSFQKITRVAVADWNAMQMVYQRDKAIELAIEEGIPVPQTYVLDSPNKLNGITEYPVVLKSSDFCGDLVKYCNSRKELEEFLSRFSGYRRGVIAQNYIRGFGCGFYGIYNKGQLIAHFLHRRLSEFPITGGASAIAESYYDEQLLEYGRKLGNSLSWHGPIMAEFKYDEVSKDYRLIEINPKLWGSLDLTIAAGVNVPDMLVKIALGQMVEKQEGYEYVRYTWLFPNQWKVLLSTFSIKSIADFILAGLKGKTNMIFFDPVPTLMQIAKGLYEDGPVLFIRHKRLPHGKVEI